MDTELDIRLEVTGLHIVNKAEVATAIDNSIDELSSLLTVKITDDEIYKTYKDARRLVKNERDEIWSTIKDKVNDFEHDIIADRKELYGKYDEIYDKLSKAIHEYEETYEIGSVKARNTRNMNKQKAADEQNALLLTLQCPSAEIKARIIQLATDLGAIVL